VALLFTVQPRYIQLRAVKFQQSPGARSVMPAKDKPRPNKSLQQQERNTDAAVTTSSNHSRLQNRHFMDAIVRLSPIKCKVCFQTCYVYRVSKKSSNPI